MNTGLIHSTFSGICAVFAWITIKDAQVLLACVASVGAIASAFFAIRYYIRITPEKKKHKPHS